MSKTLRGVLLGMSIAVILAVGVMAALGLFGGGNIERTVSFSININPSGAYELLIVPTEATVTKGDPLTFAITATPSDGFDAAIALTVAGLPDGSWQLTRNPMSVGAYTTQLVVNTNLLQSNRGYSCSITGIDQ